MSEIFSIELLRSLIAVITGATISLVTVFGVEYFTRKKEGKEWKRKVYSGLLSTLNSMKVIENEITQHRIFWAYFERLNEIEPSDYNLERYQYHQNKAHLAIEKMSIKTEKLDYLVCDYSTIYFNDIKFNKLMNHFYLWSAPEPPNYSNKKTKFELDLIKDQGIGNTIKIIQADWKKGVANLDTYIYEKLIN